MKVVITPGKLRGSVTVPSSKSYAQRAAVLSAFADKPTDIYLNEIASDTKNALRCIKSLGGDFERKEGFVRVFPVSKIPETAALDFGESALLCRLLVPLCSALGGNVLFDGADGLKKRPILPLINALKNAGAVFSGEKLPFALLKKFNADETEIDGSISSQYVSGMLFAMAVKGGGRVNVTGETVSSGYIDMSLYMLKKFGITAVKDEGGITVSGEIKSPGIITVEGDESCAAFWKAANLLGCKIDVCGRREDTLQPDAILENIIKEDVIDITDCPDLAPVIAVCAAGKTGITKIVRTERLRTKESDRVNSVAELINSLGGKALAGQDEITVYGNGGLKGGKADACGDHRIVMAGAIASVLCSEKVEISGAEAVKKSYPKFFEDFAALGGEINVL